MKQMILGFCFLVMIIYATYINMNVSARMNRETELSQVVSHCVRQTLWMDAAHGIHGNRQMKEFFEWILSEEISSKGNLSVNYVMISQPFGILSVKVTEKYQSPDGKNQQISVKKTAFITGELIKERLPEDDSEEDPDEDSQEEKESEESEEEKTASSTEDADAFDQYENIDIQMSEGVELPD